MKIYYSSMFTRETINSIDHLVKLVENNRILLCLDTNICIYLRDLYNNI